MGMVAFFPWLRVRKPVEAASFRLFMHQGSDSLPEGVNTLVTPDVLSRLLGPYRVHAQHAEREHCLVQWREHPIGENLDDVQRAAVFRLARHVAVAGLATRRFDGSPMNSYSASGHYQVIVQQFPTPFTGSVVSTHRRKDGETRVLASHDALLFQIPEHLVGRVQPELDLALLHALEAAHAGLDAEAWGPFEASITQFLMANSDSPTVPLDGESVATYAALERLVDADHRRPDFLKRVLACLAEVDCEDLAHQLRIKLLQGRHPRDVVSKWLEGLYALRGNAGHGYPITKMRRAVWSQHEHLLAGAFVFPLALKCRLQQAGYYRLTNEDIVHITGLDLLLGDRPFFAAMDLEDKEAAGSPEVPGAPGAPSAARRGWARQMEVLGRAFASHELARYVGEAFEEGSQRSAADDATA